MVFVTVFIGLGEAKGVAGFAFTAAVSGMVTSSLPFTFYILYIRPVKGLMEKLWPPITDLAFLSPMLCRETQGHKSHKRLCEHT